MSRKICCFRDVIWWTRKEFTDCEYLHIYMQVILLKKWRGQSRNLQTEQNDTIASCTRLFFWTRPSLIVLSLHLINLSWLISVLYRYLVREKKISRWAWDTVSSAVFYGDNVEILQDIVIECSRDGLVNKRAFLTLSMFLLYITNFIYFLFLLWNRNCINSSLVKNLCSAQYIVYYRSLNLFKLKWQFNHWQNQLVLIEINCLYNNIFILQNITIWQ